LLSDGGLDEFYRLGGAQGVRGGAPDPQERYAFLDAPEVRSALVDYSDERRTRVTFRVPAIHCVACVWLLEHVFRLRSGIGSSSVNFLRREVSLTFDPSVIRLSEVASLLASLGYQPDLRASDLEGPTVPPVSRRLWLQLGVAGFAFGNTMLLSLAMYLGLDSVSGPAFRHLAGWISFILSLPVVTFSAWDYYQSAWNGFRRRVPVIEIPIALGILALMGQSVFEVFSRRGDGYFDSLAGLLFFLLCGKLFQQKTYARLVFDRDYRAFFPLAVSRLGERGEERVAVAQLAVGDRLVLRHGELVPADSRLLGGEARIDYAFVTGESQPESCAPGGVLFAGGRQMAGRIEVETLKPVSQGYLTSLWNQEAFQKARAVDPVDRITEAYSRRFSLLLLVIASGAAAAWWILGDGFRAVQALVSVLIVACPCALALASPFTLGTAQRVLGRLGVYLKNPFVLETLARVDCVVFDKTGTLTRTGAAAVRWEGETLKASEIRWIRALISQSSHPLSARVRDFLGGASEPTADGVAGFVETPGRGIAGGVEGIPILVGSMEHLRHHGVEPGSPPQEGSGPEAGGSRVHVALDGRYRGFFVAGHPLRPGIESLLETLRPRAELALLSGDNAAEEGRFRPWFGTSATLRFHQSPAQKLEFIRQCQADGGRTVLMVGDGLNDAGALQQADVGVAVVEEAGAFSPASDLILAAGRVPDLDRILGFAGASVGCVHRGFLISGLYNVIGISIAASGRLSPVVCAILMPLSSFTVVAFSVLGVEWLGRRWFAGTGGGRP
jgi:Cu+-exporting ATPase